MKKGLLIILTLLLLGSCATYSCNTKTAGKCQSVSDVYNNVDKKDEEVPVSNHISSTNDDRFKIKEPVEGRAILSEPKVLRVLLNYWEDEEKDLNLGGYIFVKVRESEWQML